jgi:hypothetical protein
MAKKITLSALAFWSIGASALVGQNILSRKFEFLESRIGRNAFIGAIIAFSLLSLNFMRDVPRSEVSISRQNSPSKNLINAVNIFFGIMMAISVLYLAGFFGASAVSGPKFILPTISILAYFLLQLAIIKLDKK